MDFSIVIAEFPAFFTFVVFVVGAAIGSFLNVCIYRLPESLSLTHPRSMCPHCRRPIPFYDNIPILSYLILRGKCRRCGTTISPRYPVVELAAGLFAVAVFVRHGISWDGLIIFALLAALLVITFIDIDHRIIPNIITYPGIIIGFGTSFLAGLVGWRQSLLGIALGAGILILVAWGYYLLTKKEGMGGGDVKLLAMIGAFLGWKAVVFSIFVGSAVGAIVGVAVAVRSKRGRKTAVPFGPFLSLGAILYLFHGPEIVHWYFGLMR